MSVRVKIKGSYSFLLNYYSFTYFSKDKKNRCLSLQNNNFFTVAQSIQNIMVTEQQLGVGNVNSTSNNQSCEDGKNSNKSGSGPRKKQAPNNKSAPSSNTSSESPGSEVTHDQQAAFLRLLAGQNPGLQTSQMASFLKQSKGPLNGISFSFFFSIFFNSVFENLLW